MFARFFAVLTVSLLCANSAAASLFTLTSSPAEPIWQGESFFITEGDEHSFSGWISDGSPDHSSGVRIRVAHHKSTYGPDWDPTRGEQYHYWWLRFDAPLGSLLEPGLYEGATRYPFNQITGDPGIDISGDHLGYNTVAGFFEVLHIGPDSFAATFTQYGDGNTEWWASGSIYYNCDPPVVPEPASMALVGSGIIGLTALRRKAAA